jgi:hypothetical protein
MNDEDKTGSAPGENSVREGNLFSNTNILIANASDSCTWGEIYRSRQDQPVGFAKIIGGRGFLWLGHDGGRAPRKAQGVEAFAASFVRLYW